MATSYLPHEERDPLTKSDLYRGSYGGTSASPLSEVRRLWELVADVTSPSPALIVPQGCVGLCGFESTAAAMVPRSVLDR